MKITKQVKIPARTEERTVGVLCDICGTDMLGFDGDIEDWAEIKYSSFQSVYGDIFPLKDKDGNKHHPDGLIDREIDLCGDCFRRRVISAMFDEAKEGL